LLRKRAFSFSVEALYNLVPEGGVIQVSLWGFPFVEPATMRSFYTAKGMRKFQEPLR